MSKKTIEPIFTADINNDSDIELLRYYFCPEALEKAFGDGGGGHGEMLENAAIARLMQRLENELPPHVREHQKQERQVMATTAAIARQTRDDEPDVTATQPSLFD